jgi:pimeloyl-ACP methyl ester carboxylesterase
MFIQLKDFKVYASLVGEKNNNPTILMEAGYGDYSQAWNSVISEISLLAKVLVYDRAGLGKSEKSRNPRTGNEMVMELKELLTKLNVDPPYLFVGHSFGGIVSRLYLTAFPDEVSGLLLIDSTPEDYRDKFLPSMSQEFQRLYRNQFVREGNYNEFMESLRQVKESRRVLSVPLIVLSAGNKDHYSAESQALWNTMQKELTRISTNSEFYVAENSAHYIQDDAPEIVLSSIKRLLEKISSRDDSKSILEEKKG